MRKTLLAGLACGVMMFGGAEVASASSYQIFETYDRLINWDEARTTAQALGPEWDLASITSQDEFDTIATMLGDNRNFRDQFWIGGYRVDVGGNTFEWVSGEAWVFSAWWSDSLGIEPNGDGKGVTMDFHDGWGWNDMGGDVIGFIAENNSNNAQVPEPTTMLLFGTGIAGLAAARRRKKTS